MHSPSWLWSYGNFSSSATEWVEWWITRVNHYIWLKYCLVLGLFMWIYGCALSFHFVCSLWENGSWGGRKAGQRNGKNKLLCTRLHEVQSMRIILCPSDPGLSLPYLDLKTYNMHSKLNWKGRFECDMVPVLSVTAINVC